MDNRPIGIFDSGVGGLSILREIKKLLPKENFIFVADQKNMPYGHKTQKQIQSFSKEIMDFLTSKNVKAVVIACNTATVYAIDHLRSSYQIPVIGTVPVVGTIAKQSKTKKVAVFSTPGTAKSKYLKDLIKKFGNGTTIYKVGGKGLEELVEEGNLEDERIEKVLNKSLMPLLSKNVDAIALGCTHYPFLREKIQKIVGKNVLVLDSGEAVARRVKEILENNGILASKRDKDIYYTTGNPAKFKKVAETLLNRKLENFDYLAL